MEKMINLRHLLMHEVQDLYSAEEQIIKALPAMIDKARNKSLKKALQDHLKVTEQQKGRLDEVKQLLMGEMEEGGEQQDGQESGNKKGFLSKLFGGANSKCRGMEGLIEEGEKVMSEDMSPEVLDAAIIASAQKIEHYEICGYGTARAYARELNLGEVAELLEETLDEEYETDDRLTDLAVGRLNEEAEAAIDTKESGRRSRTTSGASARSNGRSSGGTGTAKKTASRSNESARSSKSASKTASKSSSRGSKASKSSAGRKGGASRAKSSSSGKNRASRAGSR